VKRMSFSSSSFPSSSSASPPTKSSSTPPTPTKPRSFSVSSLSQNAYYHLYHSLPSTPRLSLPLHRTSIIDQATSTHSHHQIINIAVKKLIGTSSTICFSHHDRSSSACAHPIPFSGQSSLHPSISSLAPHPSHSP
jgi:hypothetical protein